MSTDYSLIRQNGELFAWLTSGGWMGKFDAATLNRSKPYTSPKLISGIAIKKPKNVDLTLMQATISGTSVTPYRLLLAVSPVGDRWDLHTECSCPVGHMCKHAAAVLALVSSELLGSRADATDIMPPEVSRWLKDIRQSSKASVKAAVTKKEKAENRFLAYCIEKEGNGKNHVFVLRAGIRRKDGSTDVSDTRATSDLSRAPKYFVLEDSLIVATFHRLFKKRGGWGDLVMKGEGFDDLLRMAFESGRLFYGYEDPGERSNIYYISMAYKLVEAGPDEFVTPEWEASEKGGMRPVLKASRENLIFIPTVPIRYIAPETATLGLVTSGLSPEMLVAWSNGPEIDPAILQSVSDDLLVATDAALPTPKPVETVRHEGLKPVPHLMVGLAGANVRRYCDVCVTGKLRVRYGDSGALLPVENDLATSHVEMRDGKRVIWERKPAAERKFGKTLVKGGFLCVNGLLPPSYVREETRVEYMPDEDSIFAIDAEAGFKLDMRSETEIWLYFLNSDLFKDLKEAGWVIEIAPDAGLTIHDVSDFFADIEGDPDHGIDWFSFDITHEINGKKVSLIPIIAQAIRQGLPSLDAPDLPETILVPCDDPADGMIRFPAKRLIEIVDQVRHLFHGHQKFDGPIRLDRLAAAGVADSLAIDGTGTLRALAELGKNLRNITSLPALKPPKKVKADLREYQQEGFQWLQFLASNGLHGILADDMGLGKTVQTLAHLAAEKEKKPGRPSLVIAPTSVVPNWAAEAEKFTPHLKTVVLQGKDRAEYFSRIAKADLVVTSYPLLTQDFDLLSKQDWHVMVLDEAQYIKNPKALTSQNACKMNAAHRVCLSGTPMENHLGELWSLMRFLMPGFLADEKTFNTNLRRPIERDRSTEAQLALNRRVAPLILRRTKNEVATELPEKTEIIHGIELNKKQTDLYESVRAAMDKRVREAIAEKGLAKSHIIVLDALLKLRQICCHPKLLNTPAAQKVEESAKLDFLTEELLPTLIEEGRRILLFSTFTSMLAIIEEHLKKREIPYLIITGKTTERASLVRKFQEGEVPVFLISLKAGGTGLNLTAADTVIHYDPWWNPSAENQATDRAHRIGQTKPVFVHKLVCRGSIEDRIVELQKHKAALVEALLSEETSKLRIDPETLGHLLSPIN